MSECNPRKIWSTFPKKLNGWAFRFSGLKLVRIMEAAVFLNATLGRRRELNTLQLKTTKIIQNHQINRTSSSIWRAPNAQSNSLTTWVHFGASFRFLWINGCLWILLSNQHEEVSSLTSALHHFTINKIYTDTKHIVGSVATKPYCIINHHRDHHATKPHSFSI